MMSDASGLNIALLRRLIGERNLKAFFQKAAVEAARLVGADGAALVEVISEEEVRYRFFNGLPEDHQKAAANLQFHYASSTVGDALVADLPLFTANYPQHPRAMPAFVASGLKANLLIPCGPMGQRSAVLAVAWFSHYPTEAPSAELLDFLMLIADLMHAALYRQSLEDDLACQARHDVLTGLPNRRYLGSYFNDTVRTSISVTRPTALALIDLDDFKQVNDGFGHVAGDRLLCQFAERLRGFLEEGDIAARLGGDEFVLILSRDVQQATWNDVFDRLSATLQAPYRLDNATVIDCRASVGVTCDIHAESSLEHCIHEADQALLRLKQKKQSRSRSWEYAADC